MLHYRRCRACRKGMFCDQKCQTLGWKDHRSECKAFKMYDTMPNIEVRLLGRIVTRYKVCCMSGFIPYSAKIEELRGEKA